MKTQVNLQMTLNEEETLAYVRIFVKRADILNGIGIETGYHWKKYSYSKHSSPNKNIFINHKTANE